MFLYRHLVLRVRTSDRTRRREINRAGPTKDVSIVGRVMQQGCFQDNVCRRFQDILRVNRRHFMRNLLQVRFQYGVSITNINVCGQAGRVHHTRPNGDLSGVNRDPRFLVNEIFEVLHVLMSIVPYARRFQVRVLMNVTRANVHGIPHNLHIRVPIIIRTPMTSMITNQRSIYVN